MPGRRIVLSVVVVALVGFRAVGANENELSGSEVLVVRQLLEARDPHTLDDLFRQSQAQHPAVVAVYRWQRLQLVPGRSEERRYLQGLPATANELWSVYKLTYPGLFDGNADIVDVVYGMFENGARLARKHRRGHRRVLDLCLHSDGELAESAWEWCDWLLQHDPERSLDAIQAMPELDRQRICPDVDVGRLTTQEAANGCIHGN